MTPTIHRKCVCCGNPITIELADDGEILSGGGYWKFSEEFAKEHGEYWECESCMEDDE